MELLVESKMEYYCETSDDGTGKTNYHIDMVHDHDDDDDDDGDEDKKQSADHHDHEDVPLPGFRFHPTDEELVGFYLRRKVEKRPISIELIKQIDIYKYDPWDLPKGSNVGDKEWYFFCKRGRKYRNSIRPNRVTGSGFWKATGIDRPIYGEGRRDCIGLKKSLVYYRGSAGKGTKTDWMMHEFRLPPPENKSHNINLQLQHTPNLDRDHNNKSSTTQEAEVWTLCRILKRNVSSYKKCIPDWRSEQVATAAKRSNIITNPVISAAGEASSSGDSSDHNNNNYYNAADDDIKQGGGGYNIISFQNPALLIGHGHDDHENDHHKKRSTNIAQHDQFHQQQEHVMMNGSISSSGTIIRSSNQPQTFLTGHDHHHHHQYSNSSLMSSTSDPVLLAARPISTAASYSSYVPAANLDINEFSKHGEWDDLRSVVEFAVTDPIYSFMH